MVELAAANPHLPYLLASPEVFVCKDGLTHGLPGETAGTGCFRTVRVTEARHFLGQKTAYHYKDGRAGWVDRFEVAVIPDMQVRAEAVRDGFVDIAVLPDIGGLRNQAGLQFHPSVDAATIVARADVGVPDPVASHASLDDARIAERWWKT